MRKPPAPKEAEEQRTLADYLNRRQFSWIHVPNEGKRSIVGHVDMKRQGLSKGFPDNLIFDTPTLHPNAKGLAIELKRIDRTRSKPTPEQEAWLVELKLRGWITAVCYGAWEAVERIERVYAGWTPW